MRSGNKGVVAQVGGRSVALSAFGFETDPEHAFFRNFDERSFGVAGVGHDNPIVILKKSVRRINHIKQSLTAGGFFVGHERQFDRVFGNHAFIHQRFGGKDGGDQILLIVFHAAAVNPAVFHVGFVRIAAPEAEFARRDNIHMGNDPDKPVFVFPLDSRDKIGADSGRHSVVRSVVVLEVFESHLQQTIFQKIGFHKFSVAAVFRSDGGMRAKRRLQFNHPVTISIDPLRYFLK